MKHLTALKLVNGKWVPITIEKNKLKKILQDEKEKERYKTVLDFM